MGQQPKPVEDDLERALASMRAGFLSGSEQIAAHIASLEQHLADAPLEEREAVRSQVTRLVAAHERIAARVTSAPASSWDSFKVMVSAVKQQQAVLDQVSHLVKEHVLPRQLESLSAAAAPPPQEEPPPPPVGGLFPSQPDFPPGDGFRAGAAFHPDRPSVRRDASRQPRAQPVPRGRRETGFRALAAAGLRTR